MIDPRPFLAWWADRKAARDPAFKAFRMRFFVSLLLMLAALAFFPDWLVLTIFFLYWILIFLRK